MFMISEYEEAPSLRSALCTVAVLAAIACGGDTSGPSAPVDASGTYALAQLRAKGNLGGGGTSLPVTFVDGAGNQLTFKSGSLVLNSNGSYTLVVSATYKSSAVTLDDEGSYTRAGDSVTFASTESNPRMFSGKLSGTKLTAQSQFAGLPFEIDLRKN